MGDDDARDDTGELPADDSTFPADATQPMDPVPRSGPRRDDRTRTMPGGAVPPSAVARAEPPGYRRRLGRRIAAVIASLAGSVLIAWLMLATVPGQIVDTMAMGAVDGMLGGAPGALQVLQGIVSLPVGACAALVVALIGVMRGRMTLAGRALLLVIGAVGTTQLLKLVVERPVLGVTGALDNSLPSGHVTFVAAFAVALVMVVPTWLRSAAAVLAWAAISWAGAAVMAAEWHRLSDVIVAILVVGVWGLTLAPLEMRSRRDARIAHWVGIGAVACFALGLVVIAACTPAALGAAAADGFPAIGRHLDPMPFMTARPWLMRVLAVGSALTVGGLAAVVVHEVDRQARD